MKKTIALICALATTSAMAANNFANQKGVFGGIDYTYYDGVGDNSNQYANAYGVTIGGAPLSWLNLDLRTQFTTVNLGTDDGFLNDVLKFNGYTATNNQLELGATPFWGINNNWGVYGRVALGQTWVSDLTDFTYGSIEPGVYVKPYGQVNNTSINLGYRYRNSFDNNIDYATNSVVLGGEYAFIDRY